MARSERVRVELIKLGMRSSYQFEALVEPEPGLLVLGSFATVS
jgi:hypothetical protein